MQKMSEQEAIEALKLEGGIEITGKPLRIAKFFEGLEVAIRALEEIQQYRAIGTVSEAEYLIDSYNDMIHDFGDDMDLLQLYKAIGTVEECREVVRMQEKLKERIAVYKERSKKNPWEECFIGEVVKLLEEFVVEG